MTRTTIRSAVLAVLALAGAAVTAQAQPCSPCPTPCSTPCMPTCTTMTKRIMVTEYRQEPYETTRTSYKTEWQDQPYTAFKCELVPENHTRTVTFYTTVPVTKNVDVTHYECVAVPEQRQVTRYECVAVPEQRQVTRYVTSSVPVQHMVSRCVDAGGSYECREVACGGGGGGGSSCGSPKHGLFRRHSRSGGCGECAESCAPATTTVSVYVPHYTTVQEAVTVMQTVCNPVTETITVNVNRMVPKTETITVTTYKTVPKTVSVPVTTYECRPGTREEHYVTYTQKTTPVPMTRRVAVCVPVTERVTAFRCVPFQVEKEVTYTVYTGCDTGCGGGYDSVCGGGEAGCTHSSGHHRGGLFHRKGCR